MNAVRLPVSTTNFIIPLAGVLLEWSLVGIVAAMIVTRFITLGIFVIMGLRLHPGLRRRSAYRGSILAEVLGFGGWVTVSSMISPVLVYADRFIIGGVLTVAAVTFYTAPHEVVTRLTILPTSLVATLFPAFSGLVADQRSTLNRMTARAVKVLLMGVGLALVVLTTSAHDILRLWLGSDFAAASAPVLRLLAVGLLANALAYVPAALIQAQGRPDVPAKFHLVELPIHLLVLWLLIGQWGIAGAAAAWSLRMLLDAVLLFSAAHALGLIELQVVFGRRTQGMLALLLVAAVGASALTALAPFLWQRVGATVAALLLVGTLGWRRLFSPQERLWLRGLVPSRLRAS